MSSTQVLEAQLTAGSKIYQKLQDDFTKAVESRQRLDAQKSENESVKKEFETLTSGNKVYKLVGPVLLRQENDEAKANVANRLELINGEIKRVETQINDITKKLEEKKMELVHIQTQIQQIQQTNASESASSSIAGKGRAIQQTGV
ncbi:prefoldin subunit 6 [Pseudohyphozyma bogoriensis]|nr:prefoldin subunit 6 [Pseudohyphozyma bogoriensis]